MTLPVISFFLLQGFDYGIICKMKLWLLKSLCTVCCIIVSGNAAASEGTTLRIKGLEVWFDTSLNIGAKDLAGIFPRIKQELESTFEWKIYRIPKIFLFKERKDFLRIAGNPITVAFAVPEKNWIAIDYSKVSALPFRMENTLKHELCHILLHQHIKADLLPRWLDEGLCQWSSNSIDEMIYNQKQSSLNSATLSLRTPSLSHLYHEFPAETGPRLLAYEASKRFTIYLIDRFGKDKITAILRHLESGQDIEVSTREVLSVSLYSLENQWQQSLKQKTTWLTFVSYYLYEILFAVLALITCYGFIRYRIKKSRYSDEEEVDI